MLIIYTIGKVVRTDGTEANQGGHHMKSINESGERCESVSEQAGLDHTHDLDGSTPTGEDQGDGPDLAEHLARQICKGFVYHDEDEWQKSVAAFYAVDRHQFAHLSDDEAFAAAEAYAAALWAKDAIEPPLRDDGTFDPDAIDAADWSPVRACLERRAEIVGMDREYATGTTEGWRKHKIGEDYWTPLMRGQHHEIRVALGDPDYPRKRGTCQTGFGPLTARYLLGLELHDMKTERHWKLAVETMVPYFEQILSAHDQRSPDSE